MRTPITPKTDARRTGEWLYALGGRRFFMTMGAGIVNTILFAWGVLSENGYITLSGMTIGAYVAANTFESWKGDAPQPKKGP